jgi:hypothetical protein
MFHYDKLRFVTTTNYINITTEIAHCLDKFDTKDFPVCGSTGVSR